MAHVKAMPAFGSTAAFTLSDAGAHPRRSVRSNVSSPNGVDAGLSLGLSLTSSFSFGLGMVSGRWGWRSEAPGSGPGGCRERKEGERGHPGVEISFW